MAEYGYTPQEWEAIDREEKVLMLAKKQLEIERDKRIEEGHKQNTNNRKHSRRRRKIRP